MQMTEKEVRALLQRYDAGEATAEETAFLEQAYIRMALEEPMPSGMVDLEKVKNDIFTRLPVSRPRVVRLSFFFRYAAVIAIAGGMTWIYNILQIHKNPKIAQTSITAAQILPGTNKAVLTTAEGMQVPLYEHKGGVAIRQGVATYDDGSMIGSGYTATGKDAVQHFTITTPRGGQYQVTLPDGTRVYLNADSKLSFPSRFSDTARIVALNGEGYFEVTKHAANSFIVQIDGRQQVKVLGTRFNVSAYPEEELTTTLVEGSVQLSSPNERTTTVMLKPDQQASLLPSGFTVRPVRARQQIAWKDGLFVFRQTSLPAALKQIARWYDIEVDVRDVPPIVINADISRAQTLADLLAVLKEGTGVNIVFTKERGMFFKQ
jgi:transmembrane sensor